MAWVDRETRAGGKGSGADDLQNARARGTNEMRRVKWLAGGWVRVVEVQWALVDGLVGVRVRYRWCGAVQGHLVGVYVDESVLIL